MLALISKYLFDELGFQYFFMTISLFTLINFIIGVFNVKETKGLTKKEMLTLYD